MIYEGRITLDAQRIYFPPNNNKKLSLNTNLFKGTFSHSGPEDVWEQGAKEDISAEEEWGDRIVEKIA
jgi:hypothetical protein